MIADQPEEDLPPVEEFFEGRALADAPAEGEPTSVDRGDSGSPDAEPVPSMPANTPDPGYGIEGRAGSEALFGADASAGDTGKPDAPEPTDPARADGPGGEHAPEPIAAAPAPDVDQADVNTAALRLNDAAPVAAAVPNEDRDAREKTGPSTPPNEERANADDGVVNEQVEAGHPPSVDDHFDAPKPDAGDEGLRPCPRCGATCSPNEVEEVFGYRTMRWTAAGTKSTTVRRQSYCRKCRTQHAAEMRRRADVDESRSDEQRPRGIRTAPLDGNGEHPFAPTAPPDVRADENSTLQANDGYRPKPPEAARVSAADPDEERADEERGEEREVGRTSPAASELIVPSDDSYGADVGVVQNAGDSAEVEVEGRDEHNAIEANEPEAPPDSNVESRSSDDDADGPIRYAAKAADEAAAAEGSAETNHDAIDPEVGLGHADPPEGVTPRGVDALDHESHELREGAPGAKETCAQAVEPDAAGNGAVADAGTEDATPAPEASSAAPIQRQRRRSPQYRAPQGGLAQARQFSRAGSTRSTADVSPDRSRPASIEVRVLFQRGGYCTVALIAMRPPGLPEELTVSGGAGEVELVALQEEWYQDVVPDNLADLLWSGFVWTDTCTGQEWLLSGREVFVLAPGTAHRGFVSCPRMVLGREHVVLCLATRLPALEEVLHETGCAGWTRFGESDGVPIGWTMLRGLVPQRPAPLSDHADILNALRPLPQIEIALEGGVRLAHNSWLAGYPPAIRVYGEPAHTAEVLIDGREALASSENRYVAPGWDEVGPHQIWCSNTTKGYSLVQCETSWKAWPAYSFPFPGGRKDLRGFALCGPLVRSAEDPDALADDQEQREGIQVPSSNPILLGPQPGQLIVARQRTDVRGAQCVVFPPFVPVWALPAQPLHCDKRASRILLVGQPVPARRGSAAIQGIDRRATEQWYQLILDCSKKGLAVEPASLATADLWRQYRRHAKGLRRRMR